MQYGPDTARVDSHGQLSDKCLTWRKYKAVISHLSTPYTLPRLQLLPSATHQAAFQAAAASAAAWLIFLPK